MNKNYLCTCWNTSFLELQIPNEIYLHFLLISERDINISLHLWQFGEINRVQSQHSVQVTLLRQQKFPGFTQQIKKDGHHSSKYLSHFNSSSWSNQMRCSKHYPKHLCDFKAASQFLCNSSSVPSVRLNKIKKRKLQYISNTSSKGNLQIS